MSSKRIGARQAAYQIKVSSNGRSIWDSGKVEGSQSTGIRCGASLEENTEYQWNVTVWAAEQLPHNTHRLQPAR